MADPPYPEIGADFEGWELVEESVETVFRLPSARVRGATRRYEDVATRRAVREATGGEIDHEWRFVAATRLGFVPPLPPGTLPSMVRPMVASNARRAFGDRLVDRGLDDVEKRRTERIRIGNGSRTRFARYDATDRVAGRAVRVTGWVGVWHDGGSFFVVTGGYPDAVLGTALELDDPPPMLQTAPSAYQAEFAEAVRSLG